MICFINITISITGVSVLDLLSFTLFQLRIYYVLVMLYMSTSFRSVCGRKEEDAECRPPLHFAVKQRGLTFIKSTLVSLLKQFWASICTLYCVHYKHQLCSRCLFCHSSQQYLPPGYTKCDLTAKNSG